MACNSCKFFHKVDGLKDGICAAVECEHFETEKISFCPKFKVQEKEK